MKLYSMPGTCALSVHIALEWAQAPYQLQMMAHGDNRKPAYLAVNPSGMVPALVFDDGRVLTQAAAILMWIVDSYPQAGLGATSDRPLERFSLDERLSYLTSEVHVAFGPFFAPSRYLDDADRFEALKAKSLERVSAHMSQLNDSVRVSGFALGDRRTVADAYLYVLTRWADYLPQGISPFPNLARHRDTMESDPGVLRALAAQGMSKLGR